MKRLTREERYLRDIRNTVNPGVVWFKVGLIVAAIFAFVWLIGILAWLGGVGR